MRVELLIFVGYMSSLSVGYKVIGDHLFFHKFSLVFDVDGGVQ